MYDDEREYYDDEDAADDWDEGPQITEDDDPDKQAPAERDGSLPMVSIEIPVIGSVEVEVPKPAKSKPHGPKKSRFKPRPKTEKGGKGGKSKKTKKR